MGGASAPAGGCATFFNGESTGNCLGILLVYCLPIRQAPVIVVANGNGANVDTFTTACAFGKIHKAWFLPYAGGEVTRFPL